MEQADRVTILRKLAEIELWAEQTKQDCCIMRALIEKEENVSTFSNIQSGLTEKQLTEISLNRRKHLFKRKTG